MPEHFRILHKYSLQLREVRKISVIHSQLVEIDLIQFFPEVIDRLVRNFPFIVPGGKKYETIIQDRNVSVIEALFKRAIRNEQFSNFIVSIA